MNTYFDVMENEKYMLDEFILNESFQRYVLRGVAGDTSYWETYLKENPASANEISRAKEIITFIATRKKLPKHSAISQEVFKRLQQQIALEQAKNVKPAKQFSMRYYWYAASVAVLIGTAILLNVMLPKGQPKETAQFLEVIVPKGQRSQMVLPDGTRVWLNSGTVFKYPTNFLTNGRKVYVTGEAFFSVKHNQGKPFMVYMRDNLAIKVLGTEFNVKCYPDEKTIEATLVKGSIHLSRLGKKQEVLREINLKPNEKAVYSSETRAIDVSVVVKEQTSETSNSEIATTNEAKKSESSDLELITSWKDDALVFKDEPFEDIAIRMERWYGIEIKIVDEDLKREKFTGKFTNKETIYQVLDIFNRSESVQYTTKDKEIIISKRKR